MSDTQPSSSADRAERSARLRRRLTGGVFTALIALQWGASLVPAAHAAPGTPAGTTLEARAAQVREALTPAAPEAPARADQPAQPWGNGWINWGNGWNNWKNAWNNWSNAWNNWSNAWNNWNNWKNAWYNV